MQRVAFANPGFTALAIVLGCPEDKVDELARVAERLNPAATHATVIEYMRDNIEKMMDG